MRSFEIRQGRDDFVRFGGDLLVLLKYAGQRLAIQHAEHVRPGVRTHPVERHRRRPFDDEPDPLPLSQRDVLDQPAQAQFAGRGALRGLLVGQVTRGIPHEVTLLGQRAQQVGTLTGRGLCRVHSSPPLVISSCSTLRPGTDSPVGCATSAASTEVVFPATSVRRAEGTAAAWWQLFTAPTRQEPTGRSRLGASQLPRLPEFSHVLLRPRQTPSELAHEPLSERERPFYARVNPEPGGKLVIVGERHDEHPVRQCLVDCRRQLVIPPGHEAVPFWVAERRVGPDVQLFQLTEQAYVQVSRTILLDQAGQRDVVLVEGHDGRHVACGQPGPGTLLRKQIAHFGHPSNSSCQRGSAKHLLNLSSSLTLSRLDFHRLIYFARRVRHWPDKQLSDMSALDANISI